MMHLIRIWKEYQQKTLIGKGRNSLLALPYQRTCAGEMHILIALAMPFINIAAEDGTTVIICDFNNLYQYTIHEFCVCTFGECYS